MPIGTVPKYPKDNLRNTEGHSGEVGDGSRQADGSTGPPKGAPSFASGNIPTQPVPVTRLAKPVPLRVTLFVAGCIPAIFERQSISLLEETDKKIRSLSGPHRSGLEPDGLWEFF